MCQEALFQEYVVRFRHPFHRQKIRDLPRPRIGENNPSNLGGKTLVESQNGRKPGKLAQENNNVSYMVGMILTNLSKRTLPKPTGQNEPPGLRMFHWKKSGQPPLINHNHPESAIKYINYRIAA